MSKHSTSKTANLHTDIRATLPGYLALHVPGFREGVGATMGAGTLAGLLAPVSSKTNPDTDVVDYLPGAAQYRIAQRHRRVAEVSNTAGMRGTANLIAERIGPYTSALLSGAAGAAVGRLASKGDLATTVLSGVAGATLPSLIATIVAGLRARRSEKEQINADTGNRAALKYVVPGLAAWDRTRRLLASANYDAPEKRTASFTNNKGDTNMNMQIRNAVLQKVAEDRAVKVAAARSQARYEALVKASESPSPAVNPLAVSSAKGLGAGLGLGTLGGAALGGYLGYTYPDKKRSRWLKLLAALGGSVVGAPIGAIAGSTVGLAANPDFKKLIAQAAE